MKKVCVIGHFAFGKELSNGQTVKTKIVASELERRFGCNQVMKIDTHGGWKSLLRLPFWTFSALRNARNVVILPAQNGLRTIVPLLSFWNLFFRRRLHYAVVGGWLAPFLTKRKLLKKQLSRFAGIYVETGTMRSMLEAMGLRNAVVMPNCKDLTVLEEDALAVSDEEPYRLCTFSRVMREKGIEDAVAAVTAVNALAGRTVYTLDIYGQVDEAQREWFDHLQKGFLGDIRYGGVIPFRRSVETLNGYFALLFPTYYDGEGFAGTVIDAFFAGVPVVASDWKYNPELIREGETGRLFPARDIAALTQILREIGTDAEAWNRLKGNCLAEAKKYGVSEVIGILAENLV